MKQVRIVNSKPADKGQCEIKSLIGNVYDVTYFDEEDESVSVFSPEFDGEIVLNKSEYEPV